MFRRPVDSMRLFTLWESGATPDAICDELDLSFPRLRQLARRYRLKGHEKLVAAADWDQTEEQIAEKAYRIRGRWSEEVLAGRQFGMRQARTLFFKVRRDCVATALDG